jgi:integrase
MPKIALERSAKWVENQKLPGHYPVGGVAGLALQVASRNSRSWTLRVTMPDGRRRDMGLGPYPAVGLKEARDLARRARESVRNGIDPIDMAKRERANRLASGEVVTFKSAASSYIALQEPGWRGGKSAGVWRASFETYVFPVIGNLSVDDIATSHIIKIFADPAKDSSEHLWTCKMETAQRLRGRVEAVLDWAIAGGYRSKTNPARWKGHLELMLAKPAQLRKIRPIKHHDSVPVEEAAAFLRRLRLVNGSGARCLEFVMLTAARSGEARGALWPEIDLDQAIWTVPAERMKAAREHRVPLSRQAVTLLQKLPRDPRSKIVFISAKAGAPLADMTLLQTMRRMGMQAVPHGLRSTFRVWAAERTDYPREIAEAALAHQLPASSVGRAYLRTDHIAKRALMMQDYADFLETIPRDREVTTPSLRQKAE